jgi:hypothetical protein
MDSQERRYLHIAGAFAAGGWFTGLGPDRKTNVPIPTVAPVHLPMVGGVNEAKASKVAVDCRKADFGGVSRTLLSDLRKRTLFTLGSGYSLAETVPKVAGKPLQSRTTSEIKSVRVDRVFLKYGLLNMETSHDPDKDRHPRITFGRTEITGLKLDGKEIKVTVDTAPFNKYATLEAFEAAFTAANLPAAALRTLAVDQEPRRLHRNESGYVVGSIVKKIEGPLPVGAKVEPNGYTIDWPEFGKIVLGEITMGPYIRRVTLLRLKHSDTEFGSGCSGGSFYP